jgi:hypothetical protein
MSNNKMKYVIFPEGAYQVTVDDWEGKPYTFEVTGEEIAASFRREKLLDRAFENIYNDLGYGDLNEL